MEIIAIALLLLAIARLNGFVASAGFQVQIHFKNLADAADLLGSVELQNDEASFVDIVSGCSSLDMFHCPLAGFVVVGSRCGDVMMLSRSGMPALEVGGPVGAGAVNVVRVVQATSHRLPYDVLLVSSFDGVPGLRGLLFNHRTMEVDVRGWLKLNDAVHDIVDIRLVESVISADRSTILLPSVAALDARGNAYVSLDVAVDVFDKNDTTDSSSWPLHLIKQNAAQVFASYKFGMFVVGHDAVYRLDRQTMDVLKLSCWDSRTDSAPKIDHVAFDDVFHELYLSSLAGNSLQRHKVAPGPCKEVHSFSLLEQAPDLPRHLSSSGGYSLVSGSDNAVLYNHSTDLVNDQTAPWNVGRFVAAVASEGELMMRKDGNVPARIGRLDGLVRGVKYIGQWLQGSLGKETGFEARLAVWGHSFLYRSTMVVVSSSRTYVLLYRPLFRAVAGKEGTTRSRELKNLLLSMVKIVGLVGGGVVGLALSRRGGQTIGQSRYANSREALEDNESPLDTQLANIYAEYRRERDTTRAHRRRKVPVVVDLHQEKVDYAPTDPEVWLA